MKIRLALTLTIRRDQPEAEDLTVDLVGTHHQIPPANEEPTGFTPPEEKR